MPGKYRNLYYTLRFKEAVEDCEKALIADPNEDDALWVGAMSLRELGDFEHSLEWFEKVLQNNPARSGVEFYVGILTQCVANDDAWNGPLEIMVQGKVISLPQGASAVLANDYNEMGLYMNNKGQFKEAIRWYDRALQARPNHAKAWCNKGIALARLQEFLQAIECFDHALTIEPIYIDALYSKAGCAFELGQFLVARRCFDDVLALNPSDSEAKQCRDKIDELMKGE